MKINPINPMRESHKQRFYRRIKYNPLNGCHEWQGGHDRHHYGKLYINWIAFSAHRVAYFLFFNRDPYPFHVLHKCDNAQCVNPKHLFLGNHRDNMHDMHRKHGVRGLHHAEGELNNSAVLTNKKAIKIRTIYAKGDVTKAALAKRYGLAYSTIHRLLTRKTFKNI